jgi:hypothetical protein
VPLNHEILQGWDIDDAKLVVASPVRVELLLEVNLHNRTLALVPSDCVDLARHSAACDRGFRTLTSAASYGVSVRI